MDTVQVLGITNVKVTDNGNSLAVTLKTESGEHRVGLPHALSNMLLCALIHYGEKADAARKETEVNESIFHMGEGGRCFPHHGRPGCHVIQLPALTTIGRFNFYLTCSAEQLGNLAAGIQQYLGDQSKAAQDSTNSSVH